MHFIDIQAYVDATEWASSKQGASKSLTVVTQGYQICLFETGGAMLTGTHSAGCGAVATVLEPTLQSNFTSFLRPEKLRVP